MGRVEALIVVDPEVIAEPEDGGPAGRGGAGGVRGPAWAHGEGVVEGVGGDCRLEGELWRRRRRSGGERKMRGERRGLSWDGKFDLVVGGLRKQG